MEIDWKLVEKRMEAGCNGVEISACLHCDTDTFYKRVQQQYNKPFSVLSAEFHRQGDANIRAMQYAKAMNGNINMLFFLGKERLGQGKEEVKVSPFEDVIALKHENMILRAEIAEIKGTNANQS